MKNGLREVKMLKILRHAGVATAGTRPDETFIVRQTIIIDLSFCVVDAVT